MGGWISKCQQNSFTTLNLRENFMVICSHQFRTNEIIAQCFLFPTSKTCFPVVPNTCYKDWVYLGRASFLMLLTGLPMQSSTSKSKKSDLMNAMNSTTSEDDEEDGGSEFPTRALVKDEMEERGTEACGGEKEGADYERKMKKLLAHVNESKKLVELMKRRSARLIKKSLMIIM